MNARTGKAGDSHTVLPAHRLGREMPSEAKYACAEVVWEGPYKMKCSYMVVRGRCVRHGEGCAVYEVKEPVADNKANEEDTRVIPHEAVESLAGILAREALVNADMAGSGWDAETDSSDHFMPDARKKARRYLEAAAPFIAAPAATEAYGCGWGAGFRHARAAMGATKRSPTKR